MADGGSAGAPRTRSRAAAWALLAMLLLPVAVVVVRFADRSWIHLYDQAAVDMRVRDVFSTDTPLIGASSRGFNHPGPATFWAMAPLSVVFGRPAWATVVAAALLQGAAIAAAAWLAWRRGGLSLLLVVGAVIALSYRAMGDSAFVTAWGPNVAFPFFVLFLLLIWDVVNGQVRTLIPATAIGTFLVQAHIGYAPLVGVLGVWALVVAVQLSRHDPAVRASGSLRSTLLWSGAVAAILWAPALIETVLYPPGNLYRIARRFTGVSGEPSAGLRSGLGFLAAEFRLLPPWLGGRELQDPATGASTPASLVYLIVPIALLVVGFAAARVSGSRQHQRLLVMVALLVPTSVLAMSRSAVPTDRYLFWWREIIAVFLVAAVGLAVAGALGATERPWFRMVAGTALALVVVVGSVSLAVETNRESKTPAAFALVQRTLGQIESRPLPHGPVLVRQVGNEWEVYAALVDELERRGVPIRVDSGFQQERFGESRHATTEHVDQVWIVVQDGWLVSDLLGRRDAIVLARSTPLPDEDEAELVGIQQHLASTLRTANRTDLLPELDSPTPEADMRDGTGLDADTLHRLGELNARATTDQDRRTLVVSVPVAVADELTTQLSPTEGNS